MMRLLQTLLIVPLFLMLSGGLLAVTVPSSASAVDVFSDACKVKNAKASTVCKERTARTNPFVRIISVAITILSVIIGAAATIVIILSSFKMIRSNGNANEVAGAKNGIIYAIVGLIAAVLAPTIVGFILSKL